MTETGRTQARAVATSLREWEFTAVMCSPLVRARETADLAGVGTNAIIDPDMQEWDYGDYEGLTSDQIRRTTPGWVIWNEGVLNGESVDDVAARGARVLQRVKEIKGNVLLVAHGHFLRILTTVWLDLAPIEGRRLELSPAALSVLSEERGYAAIERWNDNSHTRGDGLP